MKYSLRKLVSKKAIVIILTALLVLSIFNTYMIFESARSSMRSNNVVYDYVLSRDGNDYKLKDVLTGNIAQQSQSASIAINSALSQGKSVYINPGMYVLTDDIYIKNKVNSKIESNRDATIIGNGHKIVVHGDDYTASKYSSISGLTLINTTIRVENSFGTTISNILFENASTCIEFVNSNTWTEYSKVEDCQFINSSEGIVFRTPTGNGTGSYSSTMIERCSFNFQDFSVGIKVERLAEFSDSQIQDVRFWIGNNGRANQTGIFVDGSMYHTLLIGVVFESFTSDPVYLFGIDIGDNCNPAPTLVSGVSFLGNWTAKIHDSQGIWLAGVGAAFKRENIAINVGVNNLYGTNQTVQARPLTVFSFKPKISVFGSFGNNEVVTVRIRIEYIDNIISKSVEKTFMNSSSVWLSDDDMLQLFPSQDIIWAIVFDAKTNVSSTSAAVSISGYGTAG